MAQSGMEKLAKTEARTAIYEAITKEVTKAMREDRPESDVSARLLRLAKAYAHVTGTRVQSGASTTNGAPKGPDSRDW